MAKMMSMKKMSAMKAMKSAMKGKKMVNAYFTMMLAAKQAGKPSFVYNGKTYVQFAMKSGLGYKHDIIICLSYRGNIELGEFCRFGEGVMPSFNKIVM